MLYKAIQVTALLFVVVSRQVSANAAEELARSLGIQARAEDLSFCFGRNSICATSNEYHAKCQRGSSSDIKPYYECLCGNGYVSIDQACDWCREVYQLDGIYYDMARDCSRYSIPIAPIPTAVMLQQSSYNATYTGIPSGAGPAPTNAPATTTDDTAAAATSTTVAQTTPSLTPSSSTSSSATRTTRAPTGSTAVTTLFGGGDDFTPSTFSAPVPTNTLRSGGDTSPNSGNSVSGLTGLGIWILVSALACALIL